MTASRRQPSVVFSAMGWMVCALLTGCTGAPLRTDFQSLSPTSSLGHESNRPTEWAAEDGTLAEGDRRDRRETDILENLRRGHSEAEAGRADQAARFYERVLHDDPDHPVAHHRLAVIADQAGDFDAAERHYRAALDQRPHDPDVLNDLGFSYLLRHRYPESEQTLRDALAAMPTHERALTNLGLLYGTIGDVERAMAVLRLTGSEEEARAKLAALIPRPAGNPADHAAFPSHSPAAAGSQIIQTAGLLSDRPNAVTLEAAASHAGATSEATRDLMERLATARKSPPPVTQPAHTRLPGLIGPPTTLAAANPAQPTRLEERQPYLRTEPSLLIQEPSPRAAANVSGIHPVPSSTGGRAPDTALPRSATSGHELPLWTPSLPAAPTASRVASLPNAAFAGRPASQSANLSAMSSYHASRHTFGDVRDSSATSPVTLPPPAYDPVPTGSASELGTMSGSPYGVVATPVPTGHSLPTPIGMGLPPKG